MSNDHYWRFGLKEWTCMSAGATAFALSSLVLRAAPPWWFLSLPVREWNRNLNKWELYANLGGYDHFWLQSLIGWLIAGAIAGLIFSNVKLRGKTLHD